MLLAQTLAEPGARPGVNLNSKLLRRRLLDLRLLCAGIGNDCVLGENYCAIGLHAGFAAYLLLTSSGDLEREVAREFIGLVLGRSSLVTG